MRTYKDSNRKTAYLTLMDVETKDAYSNLALNKYVKSEQPESPAFARELVYGVLERKITLDYILDRFVKTGTAKLRPSDRTILRMGLYQLRYMKSVPQYAAVNECVDMARAYAMGREGFVNAVLHAYLREAEEIEFPKKEDGILRYLSVEYSYEPWIVELWLDQYGPDFTEELLAAGNETPPMVIRANMLKTNPVGLANKLTSEGFEVAQGMVSKYALAVKGSGLLDTEEYKKGYFSVQDESSQLAACMLEAKPGETVLDLCAAPGGKTMAIAEMMENRGMVYASDIYVNKLKLIEKEAKRLGIGIVQTRACDAAQVDPVFFESADRVLVDAPCSGLGVIRRKPEIKYKKQAANMAVLPVKQGEILDAAAKYVKPGGTLVYSTCTVNKKENEDVVSAFLASHENYKRDEEIQLLPQINGTDGFFICRMSRK